MMESVLKPVFQLLQLLRLNYYPEIISNPLLVPEVAHKSPSVPILHACLLYNIHHHPDRLLWGDWTFEVWRISNEFLRLLHGLLVRRYVILVISWQTGAVYSRVGLVLVSTTPGLIAMKRIPSLP